MNFQQLRSAREAVRCRFNLTNVANALYTSQPGVSRQIKELEEELGIELFRRTGKRIIGLTEPGRHVLPIIERVLQEADNLRRASHDFVTRQHGVLTLAATHTQARYALPVAVQEFRQAFPSVKLNIHQGSPHQIADMVLRGEADVGIATEALAQYEELVALPCYRWTHSVIVPSGHELTRLPLTLERLAEYPLITYDSGFTGRSYIDEAFAKKNLTPNIVLSAMDADVIKTYVDLGLGVGIVASLAFEPERDVNLDAIEAGPLFGINLTRLAVRRGNYLRGFVYSFIESFAPTLAHAHVRAILAGEAPVPASLIAP